MTTNCVKIFSKKDCTRLFQRILTLFRLSVCSRILETMKKNLEHDIKKRKEKLKKHSRLRTVNIFSSAGVTVLSVSGAGVSGTGFGVIVGAPLIGVGASFGATSLITIALDKETIRKLTI